MSFLVLRAYWALVYFDLFLLRGNFSALYEKVRTYPIGGASELADETSRVCAAIDLACIWYWKKVLCLQRSAATTCLLKRSGVSARMVIGAQQIPFRAHAWVEVGDLVVNDKPYLREIYGVVDQC
jgi:hypothetical protein